MEKRQKIGVLDSGVGGLTVVKELEKLLPNEDIIYFGDNGNCPYGNRTEENIVELTRNMLNFLSEQGVKVVAVACNTISTLYDHYAKDYPFPIFSIVKPAADFVIESGLAQVGVVATEFTIKTGCYNRLIQEQNPAVAVYGEGSHNLAMLVDCGKFDMQAITEDVTLHMDHLLGEHPVKDVILGCTHYPIVRDVFEAAAPGVRFINPALEQAKAVKKCLEERGLLNDAPKHSFDIYTSGTEEVYQILLKKLEISTPASIHLVK